MGPSLDFGVVLDHLPELLWGSLGTLGLALAGMTLAMVIGVLGVFARGSTMAWLRRLVIAFIGIIADRLITAWVARRKIRGGVA